MTQKMSDKFIVENCKISNTHLGYHPDYGILTFMINVEGEGWGQGFGNYALDSYDEESRERRPESNLTGRVVTGLLSSLGVNKWEDLKGQYCRIGKSEPHGPIKAIGHITKEKWFEIESLQR